MNDEAWTKVVYGGVETKFKVDNPSDYVQRELLEGKFYESHQLVSHYNFIPHTPQSVVLDIGANIGNHTLFYARHCKTQQVVPFEANPRAVRLLKETVGANSLSHKVDLSFLGTAVSDAPGSVCVGAEPENNLGATRVMPASNTTPPDRLVPCDTIDRLIGDRRTIFMKIDVEGHEMLVLRGAEKTIARWRPAIAIEVNGVNEIEFWKWMEASRYHCVNYFADYHGVKNYILIPKSI